MQEIIKEFTVKRNMDEIDSEQVPMWAQRVDAQRAQKKALDEMKKCERLQSHTEGHEN